MITIDDLIARPLSFSSLMKFKRSPLHYIHYLNTRKEATPDMVMGSLIDCLLLTPDEYEDRFVIQPDFSKGEGVREKARIWKEENKGKSWIKEEQLLDAQLTVDAIERNPIAKELRMQVTSSQKKIKWTDKETGLPMIAYLDMEAGNKFIIDLKKTGNADPEKFIRSAMDYGYHIQAAIYVDAANHRGAFPDFFHLAVEDQAPYGICVMKSSKDFLALGLQEYRKLLQEFRYCMEQSTFNQSYEFRSMVGYSQLDLPGWALSKLNK